MTAPLKLTGSKWADQTYGTDVDGVPITPVPEDEWEHRWLPDQANETRDAVNNHADCIEQLETTVAGIEPGATADQTAAEIKALYEQNSDTNPFTDARLAKLSGIEELATADQTGAEIAGLLDALPNRNPYTDSEKTKLESLEESKFKGQYETLADLQTAYPSPEAGDHADVGDPVSRYVESSGSWVLGATPGGDTAASVKIKYESNPDTNAFTDTEKTKLSNVESGAQVNRTAGQIKTDYESNSDTNSFTDSEKAKLAAVAAGAEVNRTAAELRSDYESNADTNVFDDAEKSKLSSVEPGATADQTGPEIKSLYEAQPNTNAFTDSDHEKLGNIESAATADQTAAEIKTAYESNSDTNGYTDAEKSKLQFVSVTAAVDLDSIKSLAEDAATSASLSALSGQVSGFNGTLGAHTSQIDAHDTRLDDLEAAPPGSSDPEVTVSVTALSGTTPTGLKLGIVHLSNGNYELYFDNAGTWERFDFEQRPENLPNRIKDSGRFVGDSESTSPDAIEFKLPLYMVPENGALFERGQKFIRESASFGGNEDALEEPLFSLIDMRDDRDNNVEKLYGPEFNLLKITSGPGTANGTSIEVGGVTYWRVSKSNFGNLFTGDSLDLGYWHYSSVALDHAMAAPVDIPAGDRLITITPAGVVTEHTTATALPLGWTFLSLLENTAYGYAIKSPVIYARGLAGSNPGGIVGHVALPAIVESSAPFVRPWLTPQASGEIETTVENAVLEFELGEGWKNAYEIVDDFKWELTTDDAAGFPARFLQPSDPNTPPNARTYIGESVPPWHVTMARYVPVGGKVMHKGLIYKKLLDPNPSIEPVGDTDANWELDPQHFFSVPFRFGNGDPIIDGNVLVLYEIGRASVLYEYEARSITTGETCSLQALIDTTPVGGGTLSVTDVAAVKAVSATNVALGSSDLNFTVSSASAGLDDVAGVFRFRDSEIDD